MVLRSEDARRLAMKRCSGTVGVAAQRVKQPGGCVK
jgi:hypothetical protein